ncbi:MAG: helix-hairpin-helix domain-containing protein [Halomonas sp.]|nr:helix-hairpin-helix domain-containing protein [Halomonas sp.]TVP46754.1 MAG: helix-hairpin-helix domain-containing protein [Halomonas sp.]
MTSEAHPTNLPTEQLRDDINTLMQTVTTLIEGEPTFATLETALHSHAALSDQLAMYSPDASSAAALQRIEDFITRQAGSYYQANEATLDDQESKRFIALFARQLLALEGVGPATARQLFTAGIFTPEAFFKLTPQALEALDLPSTTLARLTPLIK